MVLIKCLLGIIWLYEILRDSTGLHLADWTHRYKFGLTWHQQTVVSEGMVSVWSVVFFFHNGRVHFLAASFWTKKKRYSRRIVRDSTKSVEIYRDLLWFIQLPSLLFRRQKGTVPFFLADCRRFDGYSLVNVLVPKSLLNSNWLIQI